jgi:hypothetical protein
LFWCSRHTLAMIHCTQQHKARIKLAWSWECSANDVTWGSLLAATAWCVMRIDAQKCRGLQPYYASTWGLRFRGVCQKARSFLPKQNMLDFFFSEWQDGSQRQLCRWLRWQLISRRRIE